MNKNSTNTGNYIIGVDPAVHTHIHHSNTFSTPSSNNVYMPWAGNFERELRKAEHEYNSKEFKILKKRCVLYKCSIAYYGIMTIFANLAIQANIFKNSAGSSALATAVYIMLAYATIDYIQQHQDCKDKIKDLFIKML